MNVCFAEKPAVRGGPGTFQTHLERGLLERGHSISYRNSSDRPDLVLLIGGTRYISWLHRMRRRRVPIVQRLDGMNWRHRVERPGVLRTWRAGVRNGLLRVARSHFADAVIYQSRFTRSWWHQRSGGVDALQTIIHNGTDVSAFRPPSDWFRDRRTLLVVEGNLEADAAS